MATAETVKAQLQADIAAANAATGKKDATMHDAVNSLIEGFGGGEALPSANGLSEFPNEAYKVNGADLTAVSEAIAEKAGVEKPVFPDGFVEAVEGIKQFYLSSNGVGYTKHLVFDGTTVVSWLNQWAGCDKMESVLLSNIDIPSSGITSTFSGCVALTTIRMPKTSRTLSRNALLNCPSLTTIELGSIGYPVTIQGTTLCVFDQPLPNLTITIYTECNDIAEATALFSSAPWGATNATIVYRNSTTGEVITE